MNRVTTFGPFRFDAESRELFRNDARVPLPPKPAHALALLVGSAGRVVRRDVLVAALWSDAHVSFDKSLNFTMLQLRRALEDDARWPRYIETLPRLGYRFVGAVDGHRAPARGLKLHQSHAAALAVLALAVGVLGASGWCRAESAGQLQARGHSVRAQDLLKTAETTPRLRLALLTEAIEALEEAVALDGGNAAHWLDLGDAHFRMGLDPPRLRQARAAIERAVELNPSSPGAQLRQGDLRSLLDWDWSGALAAYQTAVRLDPTFAEAHRHLSTHYLVRGNTDLAIAHIERAIALEPFSSVLQGEAGWTYLSTGHLGKALEHCARAVELDATATHARQCLLYASERLGDHARSAREARALLNEVAPATGVADTEPLTLSAYHIRYLATLGDSGWDRMERVLVLAALDDQKAALALLDRAVIERLPQAWLRLGDPRLDPLRDSARFRSILARLGLRGALPVVTGVRSLKPT